MDKHFDDQFKDGFERLLSDMEDAPTWEQVSTQTASEPEKTAWFRRPVVAVAAAFAFTLIAISSVMLISGSESEPPAAEMVDYVKLSWSTELDPVCSGSDIVDNKGFDDASIEIWGPAADGSTAIIVTAPDGSTERLIFTYELETMIPGTIYAANPKFDDILGIESKYRHVECALTTEIPSGVSYGSSKVSDPPIYPPWYLHTYFVRIPNLGVDGQPWDFLEILADEAVATEDEFRGIPVTIYTTESTRTDIEPLSGRTGKSTHISKITVDVAARRYESQTFTTHDEVLGGFATKIEVVERGRVATNSVSFSIDGLNVVWEKNRDPDTPDPDNGSTTTTTTLPVNIEAARVNTAISIWNTETGLAYDDSKRDFDEWTSRLQLICDVGFGPNEPVTQMERYAEQFLTIDADRATGVAPTVTEATDVLWMIIDQLPNGCAPRWDPEPLTSAASGIDIEALRAIDPAAINSAPVVEDRIVEAQTALGIAKDTWYLDSVVDYNAGIINGGGISEAEATRREAIITESSQYGLAKQSVVPDIESLVADLRSRYLDVLGDTEVPAPEFTLDGPDTVYSQSGEVLVSGWSDQVVDVTIDGAPQRWHNPHSGSPVLDETLVLPAGTTELKVVATNLAGISTTDTITVIVDPAFEVVFGWVSDIETASGGSWMLTYDPAEWFSNEEARAAAIEDGAISEGDYLDNPFYIRNPDETTSTIAVDGSTIATMVACWEGGRCLAVEIVDMATYDALLADPTSAADLVGWQWVMANPSPAWLTIRDGVVIQIHEQYMP